jgi:N-methylhydantoinase A/oxoprolinase/acetone carboxylase beta subunit
VTRTVDLSLAGQAHELTVAVPAGSVEQATAAALRDEYTRAYLARYRDDPPHRPLQAVTWRVVVATAAPPVHTADGGTEQPSTVDSTGPVERDVFFDGQWQSAKVLRRTALRDAGPVPGPVVVEDRETTILVPPGWHVCTDAGLNVVLTRDGNGAAA